MRDDIILIRHIIESAEKISRYIDGWTPAEFEKDDKTLDAVVRELTIIGEASANISDEWKEQHPKVPLGEATGMRNRIVHEYWAVDATVVWKTCVKDVPALKKTLEKIA